MKIEHYQAPAPQGSCRIAYTRWGNPDAERTLICLHGLTRNGRDFDFLAGQLSASYQVICPDMPGRGASESFTHAEDYQYPVYLQIVESLLAHLNLSKVDWLGTSMGGLIGMMLAARQETPVVRLILNDVGAFIPAAALRFIGEYVGKTGPYDDLGAVKKRLQFVHAAFGKLTAAQWQHLADHSHWTDEQGCYWLAYDPQIALAFQNAEIGDINLWEVWNLVHCPTLIVRGERSELLPAAVADTMSEASHVQMITIPGTGHAPALMDTTAMSQIGSWLEATQADIPCVES